MKNFYFLAFDSAFYWVRSGTLESPKAKAQGYSVTKVFQSHQIKEDSILCFNRFNVSLYYQTLAGLASKLQVPMVFDIDDLFWDLPEFSQDFAKDGQSYLSKVDQLVGKANIITTTQPFLQRKIQERYPTKEVVVVPNAQPNWQAPSGAVLIANTDSFKFNSEDLSWFRDIFKSLTEAGVPIQLIGSNSAITSEFGLQCYVSPEVSYQEYLQKITNGHFAYGLIPVSDSEYADCKSAIKLIEFLAHGIKVYASDILPYRDFSASYPKLVNLNLVTNRQAAWATIAQTILKDYQQDNGKCQAILMDHQQRHLQFIGWEQVCQKLASFALPTAKNASTLLSLYNFCYLRLLGKFLQIVRKLLRPLKKIGRMLRG